MDFRRCSALYLDKSMKMHGLIQAVSRTIRTHEESKICGNVICYQTSRKTMDEALAHFNNDKDVYNDVTLEPLESLVIKLNNAFKACKDIRKLANSKSESDQLEFVNAFRELMHIYNRITNYIDFDINKTDMDMKTYNELQGLYKDIYNSIAPHPIKESVLNDVDFEISLLGRVKVNFDYLVELLLKYQKEDNDNKQKVKKKITRLLLEIADKSKRELLERFVNSFMNDDIEGLYEKDPIIEYEKYINSEKDKDIKIISNNYNVDTDKLKRLVESYAFYQDTTELNKEVAELMKNVDNVTLKERIQILNSMPIDIKKFFDKFDEITLY